MGDIVATNNDGKDAPSSTKDKLFDPSIEMLVNDFDDERTLEEEEALAAGESEDPNAELSSLQKESNMPLEELLALYGYHNENQENESPVEDDPEPEPVEEQESEPDPPEVSSNLHTIYEAIPENSENEQDASRLLRCKYGSSGKSAQNAFSSAVSRISEEEDEDYDYSPDEDEWRKVNKTIMVGSDYQAQIPEGLCHYDDALPYENEDKLLWDPQLLVDDATEVFLKKAAGFSKQLLPAGCQLRDDEHALYLLQQCGHNVEEALRRISINVVPGSDSMSLWSEDECRNFEAGVRTYGKNFHLIQLNKVRTRSVGELVQFYYLWKKSERHDIFANKSRLEKKKYTLHPGLTDFMDRFLEDQDGRDRSSSPNVQTISATEKKATGGTATPVAVPTTDNTTQNTKPIPDS